MWARIVLQMVEVMKKANASGDDLLYDLPSSADIFDSPLLLIQVTRLMCGGFIFGLRFNHVMTDATGFVQFMKAIGEIARGADIPSVQPVWKREYLNARSPPRVTCQHRAFDVLKDIQGMSLQDMGQWLECSYFFGQQELARLRNQVPPHLYKCSKFEILFACLWRCRTIALNINPDEEVRAAFPVNASRKFNPPVGFYGNTIASAVAQSSSGKLCQNPLSYALELIKKAKDEVTEEFMRSLADFLVQNGRPHMTMARTFYVTDLTRMGFRDVDYGWGKAVYGGTLWGARPSLFASSKNNKGEDGIVVTIRLPPTTIERFFIEIEKMVKVPKQTIISSL
ncbi:Benzyl alcohol o-benzoyltransferase [Thalictrum thalictroides]|uniref:Benzyl alcohol o-benzoyltransferase n=1 Tax=Thalictrum thalictroides TaxID=46969 RepID=A0A7J6WGT3_THATH|nr:Benzyl alcohol o-benzoyltransferase [Thalictrum thalictroides]